jgi:hypothetical protein
MDMIAEPYPEFYDACGHKIFRPGRWHRSQGFRPTLPMGRNLTQQLKHRCRSVDEMRRFLATCRYSREERYNERQYWQPPEEFERTKAGLCADFAIWAWRQLIDMGYESRFVGGKAGKFGEGHAWVTFRMDGKWLLLEPQMWYLGLRMPRILTLRYHPRVSVGWDGESVSHYEHEERKTDPGFSKLPGLVGEYLDIYGRFWVKVALTILMALGRRVLRAPRRAGKSI